MSDLRIVLVGKIGAGKTSAGNTILGRKFRSEGAICVKRQGEVAGRQVTVVDTPGWDRVNMQRTSEQVKQEIVRSASLCPPGPHAFLLVIPVGEFPEREKKTVKKHLHLLGERAWRHMMVLFTSEEELRDAAIKEHIEREGESLRWLLEQCGNRYHFLSSAPGCPRTQVTGLLEKVEQMVEENCGDFYLPQVYYDIIESRTPRELTELRVKYEEREEQLKQRFRKKEEDMKKKFEEEWSRRENELMSRIRQRRGSVDIPPNLSGDRGDEEPNEQKQEQIKEPEIQRGELLEAVRMGYREEAMALLKYYMKPALVVLIAVIGALIGAIGGAHRGVIGAVVGVPIGVVIALLISALVRSEARAARGNDASLSVREPLSPSHREPSLQTASASTS
ncbi:GTPase IMAP family member 9-like [Megalops cyprinoides]|uniref:GTPase IMAP family member 9-like n=1 Tax=Megalops cyprinoides TaxID=118141 RepID=UPI0018642BE0|nr:GTPase IMAP family member 9-like [Megalops cyprinoides]